MNPETIYVAPLSLVEATVADARVSHLVTLINGETLISTPPSIGPTIDPTRPTPNAQPTPVDRMAVG